jgi:hypothetical protein
VTACAAGGNLPNDLRVTETASAVQLLRNVMRLQTVEISPMTFGSLKLLALFNANLTEAKVEISPMTFGSLKLVGIGTSMAR